MNVKRGKNIILILILIFLFLFSANFISASLGAVVEINPNGTSYGHELLWKANISGEFDEQGIAIYANGIIYSNSMTQARIFAVNATTGEHIWNYSIGSSPGTMNGFGGPYYYDGIIYDAFSKVWALNATTGAQIWNYSRLGIEFNQEVALDENYLVAVSFNSHVIHVLNRTTGTQIWNASLGTQIATEPLIYEDYLIISCTGGGTTDMVAYNLTNGSILWTLNSGAYWDSAPILYDNIIYAGEKLKTNAIYLNNGSLKWTVTSAPAGTITSTPSTHNNIIFIAPPSAFDMKSKLYAYYSLNGSTLWGFEDLGAADIDTPYCQPAISNGMVFFNTESDGVDEGYMYAVNETTGSLIWRYHLNEDIFGYTSIAQGNIYVMTDDDAVYAFDFGVGAGNWTLIGYDSNRTGYCPDCITEWQNVKVNCTTSTNTTCTVINNYDHNVAGVNLTFAGSKYNWYNSTGNLVESDSTDYSFDLTSGESKTFTLTSTGEITECVNIVSPGSYFLTADLNAVSRSACINITTSNVTLDCRGHSIVGEDTTILAYGIYARRGTATNTNITIQNCSITDFYTAGLYFYNVDRNNILNVNISSGNTDGMYIYNSDWNNLTNITSSSNEYAEVKLDTSANNSLSNINVSGSTTTTSLNGGLILSNADSNNLTKIISFSNRLSGVWIYSSDSNRITNSTIYSNNVSGITIASSNRNVIINTTIKNTTSYGIYLDRCVNTSIYNNIVNNSLNLNYTQSVSYNNSLNTTRQLGINFYDSDNPYIGGNFWAYPNGTGFSEICEDALLDGFCDLPYNDSGTLNMDYLALSDEYTLITAPEINLISPSNNSGDNDGNVTFSYNVSAPLSIENCSLIFEDELNQTDTSITKDITQNFSITDLSSGVYNWNINCTDSVSNQSTSSLQYFTIVKASSFSGDTTDLSQVENLSNITNFVIHKPSYGKINFSESIDLSTGVDLNTIINISSNRIEINSTAFSELNKSAQLTLYDLTFTNPRILKDGILCSDCTEVSYSGGTFIFEVNSFSVYTTDETPVADDTGDNSGSSATRSSSVYNLDQKSYNITLREGLRIFFYINNTAYTLRVEKINNITTLNISNQIVNLEINETKKLNLTNESYYDFEIYLRGINSNENAASLFIQSIHEEILTESAPQSTGITGNFISLWEESSISIQERVIQTFENIQRFISEKIFAEKAWVVYFVLILSLIILLKRVIINKIKRR
ncbi:MAG: PQQ-binding-like beta-propeller repeat protein [Candidatus Pacearchaeota archaeon]